jgi:hypothetical protein
MSGDYTITRNHKASPEEVLLISESPRELGIEADHAAQHLTNGHLSVVKRQAITSVRVQLGVEGLVSIDLDVEARKPRLIPVRDTRGVTAIVATPDGQGFLTGGLDGELDQWSWDGGWRRERLREPRGVSAGVSGVCYLPGDDDWVTVSSRGRVDLMKRNAPVASWRLATPGSPRALAAHPARNWIAVGIKQSGWTDPRGTVELIEIEPVIAD